MDTRDSTSSTGTGKKIDKIAMLTNHYHVVKGSTIKGSLTAPVGYIVFNSGSNLVADIGPNAHMTKEIACQYIHSVLTGDFPKTMSYSKIKQLVQDHHLISYVVLTLHDQPVYEFDCDCVGGRSHNECGHEAAAQDLLGTFKVGTQVEKIERGAVRGRPRSIPVVGYSAVAPPTKKVIREFSATDGDKLVREKIIQFFHKPFSTNPFIGVVTG
jgi:hypothetical protein